jgi:DNA-binding GntR family transcriptional regulator
VETLRPVRRTLLRETAYEAIRDAIVCGDLAPGTSVSNADLAQRPGLPRAPVRDAPVPCEVRVCGNRAVAATIGRYTPLIRRLERRRFSRARARRSVERHDRLIDACATGDADEATRVTAQIWRTVGDLAEHPSTR